MTQQLPESHPFTKAPHRTMLALSLPTLFSLIAEPLTGLIDTAFIATLGAEYLAALGVGTIALSSIFWVFNFLSIGTQTEVSKAFGKDDRDRARQLTGMGLAMAAFFGVTIALLIYPFTSAIVQAMGADGAVATFTTTYIQIRLLGGPAVLITLVAFGALRGFQDMQSPLWIAIGINVVNIILDAVLIFGIGFIPAYGIAGAAWASVVGQWFGAILALWHVYKKLGFPQQLIRSDSRKLLVIGSDLFVRTGMLTFFLILTTRAATKMSADAGAAHQAIRQIWMFSALLLDAFAITGQSLIGYFIGAGAMQQARRVAWVACNWGFWTGVLLSIGMWLGKDLVIQLLVPVSAVSLFSSAWYLSALFQPLNALTFATDGIHWGTGDFRFLRNAVVTATLTGAALLYFVDLHQPDALALIWLITGIWISVRATLGMMRVWPGIGASPWKR
ncbi:MAG: MATE family efflux transporter [Rhodothermales bacterium]